MVAFSGADCSAVDWETVATVFSHVLLGIVGGDGDAVVGGEDVFEHGVRVVEVSVHFGDGQRRFFDGQLYREG